MPIRINPKTVVGLIISVLPQFAVWQLVTVVISAIEKKLAGKNVAILGAQKVGKSTLLHLLHDGATTGSHRGADGPTRGGKFTMEVNKTHVDFDVPRDLSGNAGLGYASWKEAFANADYVWYLFHSDLIAERDPTEMALVRDHLDMFKQWMSAKKSARPKIILVGTGADRSPAYEQDSVNFTKKVADVKPIKIGRVKLNHADLVVGSFATKRDARRLIKGLRDHL